MPQARRMVYRPIVTYVIMTVTVLVYIGQMLTQVGPSGSGLDMLILFGAMRSDLIMAGQFWRLITPVLLHFGLAHIGVNMYSLFVIGPQVEQFYGRWRYLALYLLGGLGGNLLSFYMHSSNTISAGASTAIFALIAAEGVFIYLNRELFGDRAGGMLRNIFVIIALNLVFGFGLGADNWGHLGGLITGLAFGWFAGPVLEVGWEGMNRRLVDQRSSATVWIAGIAILVVLLGLAFARIMKA